MLKEMREQMGMTQKELSELSGVNIRNIQQYEQKVKNINNARLYTLLRLANALHCPIRLFLTDGKVIEEYNNYLQY